VLRDIEVGGDFADGSKRIRGLLQMLAPLGFAEFK
jgi:hypothetical protein